MENRNKQLDTMKGIGIFLVILGHVSINLKLNIWIYSFHMPLFFFISGLFYEKNSNVAINEFCRKKIKSLLIPYIWFSIITFSYWYLIERFLRENQESPLNQLLQIFISQGGDNNHVYNVVLWFLPCLFIMEIAFYNIDKIFKSKKIKIITIVSLAIYGCVYSEFNNFRLPFNLDKMLVAIPFYYIGVVSTTKLFTINKIIDRYKKSLYVGIIIIFILVGNYYKGCNFSNNKYSNYVLLYILAFIGIVFVIMISNIFTNNKLLIFLGMNSLILMVIHEPIKRIILILISKVLNLNIDFLRNYVPSIILETLIILLIMYPVVIIINKYFYFMLGKRKRKKEYNKKIYRF